jgi:hypothetical protein
LLRIGFERFKHKLMELTSAALEVTVESVPMWDRAVSAVLDTLAARKPASGSGARAPAPALA